MLSTFFRHCIDASSMDFIVGTPAAANRFSVFNTPQRAAQVRSVFSFVFSFFLPSFAEVEKRSKC